MPFALVEGDLPLITAAVTTIGGGVAWVISTLRRRSADDDAYRLDILTRPIRDQLERCNREIDALHHQLAQCQSELERRRSAGAPPTS